MRSGRKRRRVSRDSGSGTRRDSGDFARTRQVSGVSDGGGVVNAIPGEMS
jgi:hypothetical protein